MDIKTLETLRGAFKTRHAECHEQYTRAKDEANREYFNGKCNALAHAVIYIDGLIADQEDLEREQKCDELGDCPKWSIL